MAIDGLEDVVGYRDAIYWLKLQPTLVDEGEASYEDLVRDYTYEKLVDFSKGKSSKRQDLQQK